MKELVYSAEYKERLSKSKTLSALYNQGKILIIGDEDFQSCVVSAFEKIFKLHVGNGLICEVHTKLKEKNENLYIYQHSESIVKERSKKIIMSFNTEENEFDENNGRGNEKLTATPVTNLAHELMHVWDRLGLNEADKKINDIKCTYLDSNEKDKSFFLAFYKEVRAVELENKIRKELGMLDRTHYGGVEVYKKNRPEKVQTLYAKQDSEKFIEGDWTDFDGVFFYLEKAKKSIIKEFKRNPIIIAPKTRGYLTMDITELDSSVKNPPAYLKKGASLTIITFI